MENTEGALKPFAVTLVTSSSRGKKVLFYHRGRIQYVQDDDVLRELTPVTLAEILAPSALTVGHKFELNVDEWRFIGHPFSVQSPAFSIAFNVVFVLQSYCSPDVVNSYNHLSHLLGSAIVHEEERCEFLQQEVKALMRQLEGADVPDPSCDEMPEISSLARTLRSVLCSLQKGNPHVHVQINEWSEVDRLMEVGANHVKPQAQADHQCVRPYSSLLLLESSESIITSLPTHCNPALHRMLRMVSPIKSLLNVSLDADIPLAQIMHFASHLVYWGKAVAIYPLSESNVYVTNPNADTSLKSELCEAFGEKFQDGAVALPELLSNFSLPISLGDLKQNFTEELGQRIIHMVAWLLQHHQIKQLHTYIYLVALSSPLERNLSGSTVSSGFGSNHTPTSTSTKGTRSTRQSSDSGHTDEVGETSMEAQLLQHLTQEEVQSVLLVAQELEEEDLELFVRLCQYFHGSHHLEEIMLRENIPRTQLLTLIDKFSEVLVSCTLPEHSPLLPIGR